MMIDLHSHFLPHIDDGARSVNESIEMLVESKKQGVELCVGTPHVTLHRDESIRSFLEKRSECISVLEEKIRETKAEVPSLSYGAEIFLDNDVSNYDGLSKLCLGSTNSLLVELSTVSYNTLYPEWLYSLSLKGFVPIVAHVERYPYIREFISELDGVNVVYQINAKSLMKHKWRSFLAEMHENGKRVIVASDMHNTGLRRCVLEKARHKLEKHHSDIVNDVFCEIQKELIK